MLNHLLTMRLALTTTLAAAAAFAAHQKGIVAPIFVSDASYLSYAIVALFAAGLASTFVRAGKISAALNDMKGGYARCFIRRKVAKMEGKNAHIFDIAGWLQVLGLLGTVIGFSIAIGGIELDDTASIVSGLRTAIGTTILGGFLSLLTAIHARMLDTATAGLVEDLGGE